MVSLQPFLTIFPTPVTFDLGFANLLAIVINVDVIDIRNVVARRNFAFEHRMVIVGYFLMVAVTLCPVFVRSGNSPDIINDIKIFLANCRRKRPVKSKIAVNMIAFIANFVLGVNLVIIIAFGELISFRQAKRECAIITNNFFARPFLGPRFI